MNSSVTPFLAARLTRRNPDPEKQTEYSCSETHSQYLGKVAFFNNERIVALGESHPAHNLDAEFSLDEPYKACACA